MLTAYLTETRRLLYDSASQLYSDSDLTAYINEARDILAADAMCVRYLTPSSNGVASIAVSPGGASYTAPVVTVAPPDQVGVTATAHATVVAGVITAIIVDTAGSGYSVPPIITITDSTGSGAVATATLLYVNLTVPLQEIYPFTGITVPTALGFRSVISVLGISFIWGNFRYTLMHKSFQAYQAYVRNYTTGYYYIPSVWAQYSQGVNGSVYAYPIPNAVYPWEWDTICVPVPLVDDSTPEAIPEPWTKAVKYYAAYLAVEGTQRAADADRFMSLYDKFLGKFRKQATPSGVTNWYGRG